MVVPARTVLNTVVALAFTTRPAGHSEETAHAQEGAFDRGDRRRIDALGGDIARMAALSAGYGNDVPGVQINRFCASGLDAVNFAAAQIMSGQHEMTICGGAQQ